MKKTLKKVATRLPVEWFCMALPSCWLYDQIIIKIDEIKTHT